MGYQSFVHAPTARQKLETLVYNWLWQMGEAEKRTPHSTGHFASQTGALIGEEEVLPATPVDDLPIDRP